MDFAQIILSPFVWLLTFFYNFFGSYGIALILFAVSPSADSDSPVRHHPPAH